MIVILTHMFVDLGAPLQSAAEDGECERNPLFMRARCQLSCLQQLPTDSCVDPATIGNDGGGRSTHGRKGISVGASAAMVSYISSGHSLVPLSLGTPCVLRRVTA
eukprot:COSAG02_NODE_2020_length_10087_cov_4.239688_6_plen_105_part_00